MNRHEAADTLSPWFTPFAPWFSQTDPRAAGRLDLDRLNALAGQRVLTLADGRPLRFVEAAATGRLAYELEIAETARVPTRCSGPGLVHDWFNALCWLRWPAIKARLNRLQTDAIRADPGSLSGRRGPLRDAITLFDESGALMVGADGAMLSAWRAFDWPGLFVAHRDRFAMPAGQGWTTEERSTTGRGQAAEPGRATVLVVGHALLEKLLTPYKAICAQALAVAAVAGPDAAAPAADGPDAGTQDLPDSADACDRLDAAVAASLAPATLARERLMPLPVLGVPGWWPENADPAFYNDDEVFRRGRRRSVQT
ncbi:MAG: DUF3025 domain-containing protein [Burkholderiaceae bacterium]